MAGGALRLRAHEHRGRVVHVTATRGVVLELTRILVHLVDHGAALLVDRAHQLLLLRGLVQVLTEAFAVSSDAVTGFAEG